MHELLTSTTSTLKSFDNKNQKTEC